MSKFEELLRGGSDKPSGKKVEFYADCYDCEEEVTEALYFVNEHALLFTCSNGHRNLMEGVNLPL